LRIVHRTAQARRPDPEEDASLSSSVTIAVELCTHGACIVGKLCGTSRGESVAHAADRTVEEFFYAGGVGGRDKQNILFFIVSPCIFQFNNG